ncbi:hypothetical protein CF168_17185 [Shewanella bicestrii]|uniref:Preprotein translocase subunit SecB n=1 Tax=Shewanella bicestrii TaxID=2018305 RepID=A0A220UR85_9GAMM|nr:hypothetical protein [Shewanella bicestrii]ASK70451.1 hypothetical protein CF168_17185 [Shewanella bicestrii]
MDMEAVKEAIDNLELLNIKLRSSEFQVKDAIDGVVRTDMQQQSLWHVEAEVVSFAGDIVTNSTAEMLQVEITFGTRYIQKSPNEKSSQNTNEDAVELAKIGATYRLEYLIKKTIPEESIKAFCEFNAVHNCWSFWREHVFSTCQKAQIPTFAIPFFKSPTR